MLKFAQAFVRFQRVSEQRGTSENVFAHFSLKCLLLPIRHNLGNDLAAALQNSHDGGLVFSASAGDLDGPLRRVHVAGLAADEGFVRFDLARQLVDAAHAQSMADAVIHEPPRFLRDADGAVDFVGTHAVPAVHNLPHGHEPLVQSEGRIFEDGTGLRSELATFMARTTLPAVVLLKERHVGTSASRALNALRPAACYNVFAAVDGFGEVEDCVLKGGEYRFHKSIMPDCM